MRGKVMRMKGRNVRVWKGKRREEESERYDGRRTKTKKSLTGMVASWREKKKREEGREEKRRDE